jgi:hypothetical protein
MDQSRRSFFAKIAAFTAAAALAPIDPEKLLWIPGAKTIFLPDTPKLYKPAIPDQVRVALDPVRVIMGQERYVLSLGTGEVYGFDDKWNLLSKREGGLGRGHIYSPVPMTDAEKVRTKRILFTETDGWKHRSGGRSSYEMFKSPRYDPMHFSANVTKENT